MPNEERVEGEGTRVTPIICSDEEIRQAQRRMERERRRAQRQIARLTRRVRGRHTGTSIPVVSDAPRISWEVPTSTRRTGAVRESEEGTMGIGTPQPQGPRPRKRFVIPDEVFQSLLTYPFYGYSGRATPTEDSRRTAKKIAVTNSGIYTSSDRDEQQFDEILAIIPTSQQIDTPRTEVEEDASSD